ncbi:MAG: glycosyltransferase family 4 protein [bacterium]
MRPRVRVAFVGLRGVPAAYGGVDRVVDEISAGLARRGHEIVVYCWSNLYKSRPREDRGRRLVYLPTVPLSYIGTLVHTFFGCLSAVRQDVDIVHINNTENAIFGLIPRLAGKKVVVQPHGPAWPVLKWGTWRERAALNAKIRLQRVYLWLCRLPTLWWADRIVIISGPDGDYISRTRTDKFVLIHNGCNIPTPRSPQKMLERGIRPREYVLFVGRFDPRKGCHYLIEAFRRIKTDLKLVIVGGPRDGSYGRFLARLAEGDPRIVFTGPIYDDTLKELFTNALVYAHPSESEGQSISLLEGLAYGNCVVTSDTPESIETAEANAYYFKTGDPDDLRRVLEQAIADPARMDEMRLRARKHVESAYQWPDKIGRYEELYAGLTGINPAARPSR